MRPNTRHSTSAPTSCVGCCENSQEEAELEAIADAMDAYDTMARTRLRFHSRN